MEKIAIDIALFLPKKIEDICININKDSKSYRPLGKSDFIPHISLLLGIVDKRNISKIKKIIDEISSETKGLSLSLSNIGYITRKDGNRSFFEIEKSEELQRLHETIMKKISGMLKRGASKEMLYKGEETGLSKTSKLMIDSYHSKFSYSKYNPHITLNCYDAKYDNLPLEFVTDRIAFCQVGNGNTCRKVFFEGKLKG